jgi:hypothetical protein
MWTDSQRDPNCDGFTNPFLFMAPQTIYVREIVVGTSISLTFVHFALKLV